MNKPNGVEVFLEGKEKDEYVGLLMHSEDVFVFSYDEVYMDQPCSIPLGPEMPLSKKVYRSESLFLPFLERVPPKSSLAYPDYCKAKGISVNESDLLTLVATLGHRGPSSFVFKPYYSA